MSFSTPPMSPSSHDSSIPVSSIISPTLSTASCIVGRKITPAVGNQSGRDIPGMYGAMTSKRPSRYSVTGFPSASNTGFPSSSTTGTLSPKILPPVSFIFLKSPVTPAPPVITRGPLEPPVVVTGGALPANCKAPCSRNDVVNALGASMSSKDVMSPEDKTSAISCALSKDSLTICLTAASSCACESICLP